MRHGVQQVLYMEYMLQNTEVITMNLRTFFLYLEIHKGKGTALSTLSPIGKTVGVLQHNIYLCRESGQFLFTEGKILLEAAAPHMLQLYL